MWKEEKTTHATTSARTIHFQSFAESPRLNWPPLPPEPPPPKPPRSEEHTSELQSLMRISYDVFCLKKKNTNKNEKEITTYDRETSLTNIQRQYRQYNNE